MKPIDLLTDGEHSRKIRHGECTWCGNAVDTAKFKDDLSLREYSISGFCQKCQDETFGIGESR